MTRVFGWLLAAAACGVGMASCGGRVEATGAPDSGIGGTGGGGTGGSSSCGPLALCNGACVDYASDAHNCGACNKTCPAGKACVGGVCACDCAPGLACCSGKCVDLANDAANCGVCGLACGTGQCSAGSCLSSACCADSQNANQMPDTNCFHGLTWIAWQYQPSCNITVTAIALHTDGGTVALFSDGGGKPGAVLGMAGLPMVNPPSWTTGNFSPPIALAAGTSYWIGEAVSICSQTMSGTAQPYYGASSPSGPWDGPYTGAFWTSQITGQCPP